MKGFLLGIVLTLAAIAATVYSVSRFGLYPIGADNPPSRLERMLASRAMDVYADKHKPAVSPGEPTAADLRNGARLYETHCALCHGGAQRTISPMQNKFNPPAPQLINRIPHDPDTWLFWVTKHGVRMTGMPTWDGVLSDTEIWQTVAFIKHSKTLPPDVDAAWRAMAATNSIEIAPSPSATPASAR